MSARVQQTVAITDDTPAPNGQQASGEDWEVAGGRRLLNPFERLVSTTRGSRRNALVLQAPEMVIFALGLAALMSLIVFTCDMLSTQSFKPTSVLVFFSAGSYCVVLIKRQRALAAAERAIMLEFGQMSAVEQPPRVLGKEERRALLNYFVYRPPEHEKGAAAEGGGAGTGDGVVHGEDEAEEVVSPPPLNNANITMGLQGPQTSSEAALRGGERCACSLPPQSAEGSLDPGPVLERTDETAAAAAAAADTPANALTTTSGTTSAALPTQTLENDKSKEGGLALGFPYFAAGAMGTDNDVKRNSGDLGDLESEKPVKGVVEGGDETKSGDDSPHRVARGTSRLWSTDEACIVCFGTYRYGDDLCRLPCRHVYHAQCIDQWLDGENHAWCPLCKRDLISSQERAFDDRRNATTRFGMEAV